jgi:hypothetical protein
MEEAKGYSSSIEQPSPTLRPRNVPDVPEDVDFLMEHLNDPNFDLKKSRPPSARSVPYELKEKKFHRTSSEIGDAESHISDRYSTSRAESRNSTNIDFDEYVLAVVFFVVILFIFLVANRPTLKFVQLYLALTIP